MDRIDRRRMLGNAARSLVAPENVSHREMTSYVLYIGCDKRDKNVFCPGSKSALAVIDAAELNDQVNIQSIDWLRSTTKLPSWLDGTPILVDKQSKKAFRGSRCVEFLEKLGEEGGASSRKSEEDNSGLPKDEFMGMVAPGEQIFVNTESNFEPIKEDTSRYEDSGKITDADLQNFLERRNAAIPSSPG